VAGPFAVEKLGVIEGVGIFWVVAIRRCMKVIGRVMVSPIREVL
jgi:hypothetical protein